MHWFLALLFLAFQLNAATIRFDGYIGKDEIQKQQDAIPSSGELTIEIKSVSADLNAVLDLARRLYQLKPQLKIKAVIFDTALGPSAILPFLADEIETTPFVSWGDITLGSENTLPTNILLNQVVSLIPNKPELRELAQSMLDPNGPNIRDWKLTGQTLVLNRAQMEALGLVKGIVEKMASQTVTEEVKTPFSHISFSKEGKNVIGRIVIDDRDAGISQATWIYVKAALESYKASRPLFVILELNTPGGEVFAAQKISDALKELDTQYNIPVVAFINNWAISAGAMLAYSSRYIVTVKDGSMGAAEPVLAGQDGKMESASEKVNSAIRTDFANRASFFGRNPYIAEAMVDKDIILVLRHGKITKLDLESQIRLSGPDPDVIITPKGKLLTLNAEEMVKYGVANAIVEPLKRDALTPEEEKSGVFPASKSPLFSEPFFKSIPNASIDTFQMDARTRFFAFLATPVISSLLLLGLMVGAYMEFSSPGFGLPGTVALTCLILIILSSYSQEIGSSLEVVLLFLGLAILLFDLFVFPTFGLLGFVGLVFFLMGLFGLMLPGLSNMTFEFDTNTFNAAGVAFFNRLIWLAATLIISLGVIGLLTKYYLPRSTTFKKFVLEGHEQTGYMATGHSDMPKAGERGEALTELRPAGKIMVNGKIFDAISSGQFIENGTPVEVLRIDGAQVVVNIDYKGKA